MLDGQPNLSITNYQLSITSAVSFDNCLNFGSTDSSLKEFAPAHTRKKRKIIQNKKIFIFVLFVYARGQNILWICPDQHQSGCFFQSEPQIHILDGLSGRAFDEIINCRKNNDLLAV